MPSWPTIISATPASASTNGIARLGVRRRRTAGSLATGPRDSFDAALGTARAALLAERSGLVTDFDGTLAPIVDDPDQARPLDRALAALRRLVRRLEVVAVVTGRDATSARRLLGDGGRELLIVGNHGMEWLEPGASHPESVEPDSEARDALARTLSRFPEIEGVTIESKGPAATLHYRQAPDPSAARQEILEAVGGSIGAELAIHEGRMHVELRPAALPDKGDAVRRIVGGYGLRGLVVAGDDVTDLDMFAAAHELAGTDGLRTAVIAVAGGSEVPDSISASAEATVPDPAAFAELLVRLAEEGG